MIYFLTVNYYSTKLVVKLINSLPSSTEINYKIIIINNSPEDTEINNFKNQSVQIINAETNIGFGKACNLGIKYIYHQDKQAIVWIINPDAYLAEPCLATAQIFVDSHPELSIIGSIIYTPTGEVWFGGGNFIPATGAIISQDLLTNTDKDYITCDWISGCSLIINLRNFSEIPLFDPAYFLYYEDFDFCRRYAQQGHLIAVTKQFSVIHQPSSITNKNIFLKIKHSTYSYLLTLERYTNKEIQIVRLTRLISYSLVLFLVKPQVALGKISGVLMYLRRYMGDRH
ncbi:glycosyltransferase family 2 protein [Nostoc sp. FACHB-152]|uniref:glycosyltransferase n=1 Tax=Nostoc sp. FACHB-152 TaxID=2692837 RepID=UPI0016833E3C|nr:glycosyltransferase family 2 protein [Nostoc sp. FACHB-152]MBD2445889.1 glycosyltransferase family 2 protein [Nostoc sp. FACHB-152]